MMPPLAEGYSVSRTDGLLVVTFYLETGPVEIRLAPQAGHDLALTMKAYGLALGAKPPESGENCAPFSPG